MRLATTVDYSSQVLYERCTPEKETQIYFKSWSSSYVATYSDQYVMRYYVYNRVVQVHNLYN